MFPICIFKIFIVYLPFRYLYTNAKNSNYSIARYIRYYKFCQGYAIMYTGSAFNMNIVRPFLDNFDLNSLKDCFCSFISISSLLIIDK